MFTINQIINLRAENRVKIYEQALEAGNRGAHTWHVTVMDGAQAATLDGISGTLFIVRADGKTVGSREDIAIVGSVVSAKLPPEAYAVEGAVAMELELQRGTDIITCAKLGAFVRKNRTDDVIVPDTGEFYDVYELIRQIDAMKAATSAANAAAGNANAAASSAASVANAWENATAAAEGLAAGSAPTVSVTTSGGKKVLKFGIPKGDTGAQGAKGDTGETGATGPKGDKGATGATPKLTVTVETGAAGTDAKITQGGTAENPTLHFVIPRGDTGSIEGLPPMTNDEIDAAINAGGGTA